MADQLVFYHNPTARGRIGHGNTAVIKTAAICAHLADAYPRANR